MLNSTKLSPPALFESRIACRSEPAPESLVLTTVNVVDDINCLRSSASRTHARATLLADAVRRERRPTDADRTERREMISFGMTFS
jgi:hypothetical protein